MGDIYLPDVIQFLQANSEIITDWMIAIAMGAIATAFIIFGIVFLVLCRRGYGLLRKLFAVYAVANTPDTVITDKKTGQRLTVTRL